MKRRLALQESDIEQSPTTFLSGEVKILLRLKHLVSRFHTTHSSFSQLLPLHLPQPDLHSALLLCLHQKQSLRPSLSLSPFLPRSSSFVFLAEQQQNPKKGPKIPELGSRWSSVQILPATTASKQIGKLLDTGSSWFSIGWFSITQYVKHRQIYLFFQNFSR